MQKQVALISRLAGQGGADLAEYLISFFHTKPRPMWNIREDQFAGEAGPRISRRTGRSRWPLLHLN